MLKHPNTCALIASAPAPQRAALAFMRGRLPEEKQDRLESVLGSIGKTKPSIIPRRDDKSPDVEKRELVRLSELIENTTDPLFHAALRFMAREIGVEGLRPLEEQLVQDGAGQHMEDERSKVRAVAKSG